MFLKALCATTVTHGRLGDLPILTIFAIAMHWYYTQIHMQSRHMHKHTYLVNIQLQEQGSALQVLYALAW